MGRFTAPVIELSHKVRAILQGWAKGTHTPLHLKQRATIILRAAEGASNRSIAAETGWNRNTVKLWRQRWAQATPEIAAQETLQPWTLQRQVAAALQDAPRPGKPCRFTPEQVAQIITLACRPPADCAVPLTHWTPAALAREAIAQGIVEQISARQVGRCLTEADLKPHLSRYWLNPTIEDPEQFAANVQQVSDLYRDAPALADQGIHVHSCDEMTGISAREQKHPPLPMVPEHVERREFEYIRQGTSGFMASRDVVTGQVEAPLIQPTRTEVDFAQHVEAVVDLHPDDAHIFVLDNLNTHQSEALVRFVIHHDQLDISPEELGKKGHSGILSSQDTRKQFLETESHSIRFLYTPKHCSWLNQIECWFSILVRRVLNKRASFASVAALEERIRQFIDYYNEHLAKPFRWTFDGKLLKV